MTIEELAMIAKQATIKSQDNSLSEEKKKKALIEKQTTLTELIPQLIKKIEITLQKNPIMLSPKDVYDDTLQKALLYICEHIKNYDPDKGSIIAWAIFIFKKRRIDVLKQKNDNGNLTSIEYNSGQNIIDTYIPHDTNPLPSKELIELIKEDPENLFEEAIFNNNPKVNFKVIVIKRVEGFSWKEIIAEFELGNTTGPISTFYQRCCKKFAPKIKEYICQ